MVSIKKIKPTKAIMIYYFHHDLITYYMAFVTLVAFAAIVVLVAFAALVVLVAFVLCTGGHLSKKAFLKKIVQSSILSKWVQVKR